VAEIRKAGAGDQAHIACSDHRDMHQLSLFVFRFIGVCLYNSLFGVYSSLRTRKSIGVE
jgi:hypothetical protein